MRIFFIYDTKTKFVKNTANIVKKNRLFPYFPIYFTIPFSHSNFFGC